MYTCKHVFMYIYMQVQPQRKKPKQRNANAYSAGAEVGSVEMQGQKNKTPTFASFHTRACAGLAGKALATKGKVVAWDGRTICPRLALYVPRISIGPARYIRRGVSTFSSSLAGWLAGGGEDHPPSNSSLGNSFLAQSGVQSVSAFSTSGATSPLWCISAAPEPERPSSSSS
jgi:hypothetical protein